MEQLAVHMLCIPQYQYKYNNTVAGTSVVCHILFQDVKQNKIFFVTNGIPHVWPWENGKSIM